MIVRAGSLLLLAYALGFILFTVTLGRPAKGARTTDAIVVVTGGTGRIEHGAEVLKGGGAKRMLVAGADPAVTKQDLIRRLGGSGRLVNCCVDLGSESVDTRSNAEEASRWLAKHGYRSFRLVTSDWHMRRASYDFHEVMGDKYEIVPDAVRTEPPFTILFSEYNKYILRRLAVLLDI
ncbi:YdcF family protein [Sphingomonas sp.]|uniref:YdcF family protein n=1 Tax=Sphingomonas sp. TaxID=28214 RepID=UPI001843C1D0|nr:YdcF family protein [Sphingomonas sp.]MBA3512266.1 YdcF family protein [Sphingomonas sp.]